MADLPEMSRLEAFRIGRSILDGASYDWAASRFSRSAREVESPWNFTQSELLAHFFASDPDQPPFHALWDERSQDVLRVLMHWIDSLSSRAVPSQSLAVEDKKKDTPQGESG